MSDVDADQVSGTVGASQPGGVVGASQVGGTVGARLAKPAANLWTPAQLGDDLALWLDVWDSDFDLRTDGGTDFVERWADLSGNQNDAVQATAANQMRLSSDRVISDGSDWLDAPPPSLEDHLTMLALVEKVRVDGGYLDISDGSSTNTGALLFSGGGGLRFRVVTNKDGAVTATSGVESQQIHLVVGQYDSTEARIRVNGTLEGSRRLSGNVAVTDALQIGALEGLENTFYAAGGMFQGVLTSSTAPAKKLEGWLAHKAARNGIDILKNLPASHPYKDAPPTI